GPLSLTKRPHGRRNSAQVNKTGRISPGMLFLLLMFELDAKLTNPFRLTVLVMLAPWDIPVAHLLASHICSRLTFNRVVTRLLAFHVWLYWPFTSNSMINAPDGWTFN